jgi:hypothetical protein
MTFTMPNLGRRQVDLLTKAAYDQTCWELSYADDDPRWIEHAEKSGAVFEAWVNYSRQTFPNDQSGYMLDYERHHGASLNFNSGDRWEFDETAKSWVIVKPNGKRTVTRDPKKA